MIIVSAMCTDYSNTPPVTAEYDTDNIQEQMLDEQQRVLLDSTAAQSDVLATSPVTAQSQHIPPVLTALVSTAPVSTAPVSTAPVSTALVSTEQHVQLQSENPIQSMDNTIVKSADSGQNAITDTVYTLDIPHIPPLSSVADIDKNTQPMFRTINTETTETAITTISNNSAVPLQLDLVIQAETACWCETNLYSKRNNQNNNTTITSDLNISCTAILLRDVSLTASAHKPCVYRHYVPNVQMQLCTPVIDILVGEHQICHTTFLKQYNTDASVYYALAKFVTCNPEANSVIPNTYGAYMVLHGKFNKIDTIFEDVNAAVLLGASFAERNLGAILSFDAREANVVAAYILNSILMLRAHIHPKELDCKMSLYVANAQHYQISSMCSIWSIVQLFRIAGLSGQKLKYIHICMMIDNRHFVCPNICIIIPLNLNIPVLINILKLNCNLELHITIGNDIEVKLVLVPKCVLQPNNIQQVKSLLVKN
jgi:hypothetical protein